ncbi:hypothetical protein ACQKII_17150 [Lysinibacillus sp. NPDC048646]|uniref:hypothetical protein n=1 Tax=Lysinibacillus sp. NPDC048646 TaxID=3390574 RepID=UPI003D06CB75
MYFWVWRSSFKFKLTIATIIFGTRGVGSLTKVAKGTKGTGKDDDFAKEPFVPDEYWHRKAPDNATSGSKIGHYRDYKGKKEKSTVIYDDFGRQQYRVDHADHSMPLDHSVPHLHERKFDDPGYSEKGKEFRYNFFEEKEK